VARLLCSTAAHSSRHLPDFPGLLPGRPQHTLVVFVAIFEGQVRGPSALQRRCALIPSLAEFPWLPSGATWNAQVARQAILPVGRLAVGALPAFTLQPRPDQLHARRYGRTVRAANARERPSRHGGKAGGKVNVRSAARARRHGGAMCLCVRARVRKEDRVSGYSFVKVMILPSPVKKVHHKISITNLDPEATTTTETH
jgi:hypothetical protein